jgi:chloride channel protein, CIC family
MSLREPAAESEDIPGSTVSAVGLVVGVIEKAVARVRWLARRFLLLTFVIVGALCGVLAVVFHRYVELAREVLIGRALEHHGAWLIFLVLITPTSVFIALAWVIRRVAPRAVGANLARVRMAYNENPKLLGPRAVGATFLATPLSLGAGAPLGPEGPIVVVTSGVSVWIARILKLPRKVIRGMIPIGVAAGISAIFNTPITGVVFALEEVLGTAERGVLGGVLVGSVAAAVVERMLLGGRPLLAAPFSTWTDPLELFGFAIVGVISGVTSGFAIKAAHRLKRRWSEKMPSMVWRAGIAGLAIGAAGLVAPDILGVGYDSISFWLHGGSTTAHTGLAFAVKLLAFVVAIAGGIVGGTFAPSLFIGTALGAAIAHKISSPPRTSTRRPTRFWEWDRSSPACCEVPSPRC